MKNILIDTSVWIDFFRSGRDDLDAMLEEGISILHPFVFGELVCGNFKRRAFVLSLLDSLPYCKPALHNEVIHFIETNKLYGKGLGWIDFNLIVSAKINDSKLFTLDKRLSNFARKFGVS